MTQVPVAQMFSSGQPTELARLLRRANVLVPTKMCRVMTKHGSDKGRRRHNYTTVYASLFASRTNEPLRIFELGLGTNNPELVSTMGSEGRPGASLRGWRELFPKAVIYGADIDRAILFTEERIRTYFCDQLDAKSIQALWARPELEGGMDIIIEDGLHTFEANISFLDESIQYVRTGGFYIVEDIVSNTLTKWRDILETVYSKRFPEYEFALVELTNERNTHDNNLLIIHRKR